MKWHHATAAPGIAGPALADDGWPLEGATTLDGRVPARPCFALGAKSGHGLLGHRRDGLQVHDPKRIEAATLVSGTAEAECGDENGTLGGVAPNADMSRAAHGARAARGRW